MPENYTLSERYSQSAEYPAYAWERHCLNVRPPMAMKREWQDLVDYNESIGQIPLAVVLIKQGTPGHDLWVDFLSLLIDAGVLNSHWSVTEPRPHPYAGYIAHEERRIGYWWADGDLELAPLPLLGFLCFLAKDKTDGHEEGDKGRPHTAP